jgi:uncharacterized protein
MSDPTPPVDPGASGSRLRSARSQYLRDAADQPIDWHPWGPEPFEVARRAGRPILLDIGAVWCHWCHVMDEGTYSDPEVARLLAQQFVAVKVDRDEHPEVDRRYQRQVSALTGEGGWPLTAFLTADGEVFLGGTYFPPQDGHGRPGFRRVLREVARLYREEPERVRGHADQIRSALGRLGEPTATSVEAGAFLEAVASHLDPTYDPINGGFGFAPKFPHPTALSFLLWRAQARGDADSEGRARETLLRMAEGGLYDQIGGGFHRYSVDEGWHIPHFEKMGTDNAALLFAYAEGARRFPDRLLADVTRGIIGWSVEVLGDPHGGFGASQDADNAPGDDGSYFTWTRHELRDVLGPDEFAVATRVFGVGSDGRMPHDPDRNVLFRLMPAADAVPGLPPGAAEGLLATAIATLKRARAARPTPTVDRALYASINGSFLRGLVAAGRVLGDPEPIALARRAADRFLVEAFTPERGVAHRLDADGPSGYGHLEDQATFALGLVELAGATVAPAYIAAAEALLNLLETEFAHESGLLRDLAPRLYDGPAVGGVGEPAFPLDDSPHLSAEAAAALAFLRFASLTESDRWRSSAARLLAAMRPRLAGAGLFGAGAALATGLLGTAPARVVVTGAGPAADALVRGADRAYHPDLWVFRGPPPSPFGLPGELAAGAERPGESRALVCFGQRCLAPVTDPAELPALLWSGGSAGA